MIDLSKLTPSKSIPMKPKVIWLTGLSGAGKSTIAQGLAAALKTQGLQTCLLDGDALRMGLNKDLGFDADDRVENIRRTGEVTKLMTDAGITVIAALISPYSSDRARVRALFSEGQFIEVFISTPIEVCIQRDPKGLYAKALKGDLKNFTGIDAPYEEPLNPELILDTQTQSVEELVNKMLALLH
jgi:adenylyl-sulfate kinase